MKELIEKWKQNIKAAKASGLKNITLYQAAMLTFDQFGAADNLAEINEVEEEQQIAFECSQAILANQNGLKLPIPARVLGVNLSDPKSILEVLPQNAGDFHNHYKPVKMGKLSGELYKVCSKDATRPAYNGVYHNNGEKVVTDAHILVLHTNQKYDPRFEGQIVNENGHFIDAKYPNYRSVIPNPADAYAIHLNAFGEMLTGAIQASKNCGAGKGLHRVQILGQAFNAENMLRCVRALLEAGFDYAEYHNDIALPNRAAVIRVDGGSLALCMPLYIEDNKTFRGFNIDIAIL